MHHWNVILGMQPSLTPPLHLTSKDTYHGMYLIVVNIFPHQFT